MEREKGEPMILRFSIEAISLLDPVNYSHIDVARP